MFVFLTPIFCFIAFLLLLLVSVSLPIIKSIYLFSLHTTTTNPPLRINFGVWGYCIPTIRFAIAGLSRVTTAYCSPTRLGWTFDSKVASYFDFSKELETIISTATTVAFVLHPIATILAFLTLIVSLFLLRIKPDNPQRIASTITFVLGILAVAISSIAFLVDIIVVSIVKNKVKNDTDGRVLLTYGSAIWLTLAATVALWFAIIGACCGVFQRRRQGKTRPTNTY